MLDNNSEDTPQPPAPESNTTQILEKPEESVTPAAPAEEIQSNPQKRLAEAELESSLSDVLPLSPIRNEDTNKSSAQGKNSDKKYSERRGLRRGNNNPAKTKPTTSVGLVDNPADVKETLSGTGPKPRKENRPPRKFSEPFSNKKTPEAPETTSSQDAKLPAEEKSTSPAENTPKEPKTYRHLQSNSNNGKGSHKLIIEPAKIPVQEEPSFWDRLKTRILAFFKIGKKGSKKHGKKKHYDKFNKNNRKNGHEFRKQNGEYGHKHKHRSRNSNFRGNRNRKPQNKSAS